MLNREREKGEEESERVHKPIGLGLQLWSAIWESNHHTTAGPSCSVFSAVELGILKFLSCSRQPNTIFLS